MNEQENSCKEFVCIYSNYVNAIGRDICSYNFISTFIWFSYNVASIMCNNNDNQIVKGQLFVQSAGPVLRERWQTVVIWTCLQEDRRFIWMQSKLNTKGRLYIQYILLFSSLFCSCWTVSSSGSDGRCSLVLMALDWGNYVH